MVRHLAHTNKLIVEQDTVAEVDALKIGPDSSISTITLSLSDGRALELRSEITALVEAVFKGLSQGKLSIERLPDTVSTTVAADLLGVTRPTLAKWIREGKISATKIGSHSKLRTSEVLRLHAREHERRQRGFESLRQFDEKHRIPQ